MAGFCQFRRGANMADHTTSYHPPFQLTIIFNQNPLISPLRAIFLLTICVKYVFEIKSFGHVRVKSCSVLPGYF